nr:hypothetical protein [uncultured Cohaesibacter sp.]
MTLLTFLAPAMVGLLILGLIVKYMRQSRVRQVALSSLQFLPVLSQSKKARARWQLAKPLQSPLLWLRLLFLILLFATLLLDSIRLPLSKGMELGVLIAVDHSPSMAMGTPSRLRLAEERAQQVAVHVKALGGCSDQVALPTGDGTQEGATRLMRNGVAQPAMLAAISVALARDGQCRWTHLVVLSDLPKPPLFSASAVEGDERTGAIRFDPLWFQVGRPEGNRALAGAGMRRSDLADKSLRLIVDIADYGTPSGPATLALEGPDGAQLQPSETVDLMGKGDKQVPFTLRQAGVYQAILAEEDGFAFDNRLRITVGSIARLPLLLDKTLEGTALDALAHRLAPVADDAQEDVVQIGLYSTDLSLSRRGIYLVAGTGEGGGALGYFDSHSPLLEAVDLDLLEAERSLGLSRLPDGFKAIAAGSDGRIWIAAREGANPAILMPQPVGGANADLTGKDHLTWLVSFVNAYRYVNADRQPMLKVEHVDAAGAVIEDVVYESDVAKPLGQNPAIEDIQPVASLDEPVVPLWPWLLLGAILCLVFERILALRLTTGRSR